MRRDFAGGLAGQRLDAALGYRIRRSRDRCVATSCKRADVDDGALFALDHARQDGPERIEISVEVHVDDALPFVRFGLPDHSLAALRIFWGYACIVDEEIDRAKVLAALKRLDLPDDGRVARITANGTCDSAQGTDFGAGVFTGSHRLIHDAKVCTAGCEGQRDLLANAAARTRHDGVFAQEGQVIGLQCGYLHHDPRRCDSKAVIGGNAAGSVLTSIT